MATEVRIMMDGMGWGMMGGALIIWILVIVALVLAIAALLKYLRSGTKPPPKD